MSTTPKLKMKIYKNHLFSDKDFQQADISKLQR